jgi:Zn-dependent metalloprotease
MTNLVRPIGIDRPHSNLVVAFDGSNRGELRMTRNEIRASSDTVLRQTVANASSVMDFLKDRFGRTGLDGAGQKLEIVAHAADPTFGGRMNNAYWDTRSNKMYVGDGDGKLFSPLGGAIDIIAHEVGHAILDSEVRMGFSGQEGALHESFGDVLGSLIDADDWQIGEDALTPDTPGDAIRDMSKPGRYTHMDQLRGPGGEPHLLADIPNLVAVRVAEQIGRRDMGKVWYQGFTEHLPDHGKFSDAAAATLKAAELLYGAGSKQATAVSDAWTSVGVLKPAA